MYSSDNTEFISVLPYIIQNGDTLNSIADEFNIPVEVILSENSNIDPYELQAGVEIYIPISEIHDENIYEVNRRCSMYSLAEELGIPLKILMKFNPMVNPQNLFPGQNIFIPDMNNFRNPASKTTIPAEPCAPCTNTTRRPSSRVGINVGKPW